MSPREFIDKWGLTRAELASILNKKMTTVDHWFSAKSPLEPPPDVQQRLVEIDTLFSQWKLADERLPQLRELYETIRERSATEQ